MVLQYHSKIIGELAWQVFLWLRYAYWLLIAFLSLFYVCRPKNSGWGSMCTRTMSRNRRAYRRRWTGDRILTVRSFRWWQHVMWLSKQCWHCVRLSYITSLGFQAKTGRQKLPLLAAVSFKMVTEYDTVLRVFCPVCTRIFFLFCFLPLLRPPFASSSSFGKWRSDTPSW